MVRPHTLLLHAPLLTLAPAPRLRLRRRSLPRVGRGQDGDSVGHHRAPARAALCCRRRRASEAQRHHECRWIRQGGAPRRRWEVRTWIRAGQRRRDPREFHLACRLVGQWPEALAWLGCGAAGRSPHGACGRAAVLRGVRVPATDRQCSREERRLIECLLAPSWAVARLDGPGLAIPSRRPQRAQQRHRRRIRL